MALCISFPFVLVAIAISVPEIFKAVRSRTDETSKMPTLALGLFGVTLSPIAVFILGFLRNV
jgi:Mn2+/Fe2+ NRAMP family transporter